MSSLLPELILREIRLPTPTTPGLSRSAHFSPFAVAELQNPAVAVVDGFNKLMVVQLGVKVNPKGNFLISASVLFPLTDSGLKSRLTTIVGMDYAF